MRRETEKIEKEKEKEKERERCGSRVIRHWKIKTYTYFPTESEKMMIAENLNILASIFFLTRD